MVLFWFVLGVLLVAVELHHLAFFAMFGAAGSFAAAVVAFIAPDLLPVQVGVAVAVATIGVLAVRPWVSNTFHPLGAAGERHGRGVHGTLVGEEVLTLDTVGGIEMVGHVRLAGERWLASSESGEPIPGGTKVRVKAVDGTTLVVATIDDADAEGDHHISN